MKKVNAFTLLTTCFCAVFLAALVWFYSAMPILFLESVWRMAFQKAPTGTNILLVGVDNGEFVKRSDTIALLHLSPNQETIALLSIPRDTLVNIPGKGLMKINHAYARGGMRLLKKTVSTFLELPVKYHIQVSTTGLAEALDAIGGVEVEVDKDLSYTDNAGGLHINLKKGVQKLSGQEAVGYARFRRDFEGDIGRIRRQQRLIHASLEQIRKNMSISVFLKVLPKLNQMVETNLPMSKMISLARLGFNLETIDLKRLVLPGEVSMWRGISYWKPNLMGIQQVVGELFIPNYIPVFSKQHKAVPADAQQNPNPRAMKSLARASLKVEILNGNGKSGVAQKVADLLAQQGFFVTKITNAKHFNYTHTQLIDWKGNFDIALGLARLLNVDANELVLQHKPKQAVDMSVIIGKNYKQIKGI